METMHDAQKMETSDLQIGMLYDEAGGILVTKMETRSRGPGDLPVKSSLCLEAHQEFTRGILQRLKQRKLLASFQKYRKSTTTSACACIRPSEIQQPR